jgi:hypothetical protein
MSESKQQAEQFKSYLHSKGISLAFQVIFSEILSKNMEEGQVFGYTAMRLRQIGEDLDNIKHRHK